MIFFFFLIDDAVPFDVSKSIFHYPYICVSGIIWIVSSRFVLANSRIVRLVLKRYLSKTNLKKVGLDGKNI